MEKDCLKSSVVPERLCKIMGHTGLKQCMRVYTELEVQVTLPKLQANTAIVDISKSKFVQNY